MLSTIVPCLRYRDAHAGIAWLERVFGFERRAVYDGPGGTVAHAELTLGGGMVMISSVDEEGEYARLIRQPDELGLVETQTPCVNVPDASVLYAAAMDARAVIVKPLEEMPYGGRAFACRDPEGHLWFVGEYDPWAGQG